MTEPKKEVVLPKGMKLWHCLGHKTVEEAVKNFMAPVGENLSNPNKGGDNDSDTMLPTT